MARKKAKTAAASSEDEEEKKVEKDREDDSFSQPPKKKRRRSSSSSQSQSHDDDDDEIAEAGEEKKKEKPLEEMTRDCVRALLFAHSSREPLKATELRKRSGASGRGKAIWKQVITKARQEMRQVFGLEIVESQTELKADPTIYFLRSALTQDQIELVDAQDDLTLKFKGLLLAVVSFIFLQSQRQIRKDELKKFFDEDLNSSDQFDLTPEKLIDKFVKQAYLAKATHKKDDLEEKGAQEKEAPWLKLGPRTLKEVSQADLLHFTYKVAGVPFDESYEKELREKEQKDFEEQVDIVADPPAAAAAPVWGVGVGVGVRGARARDVDIDADD